MKRILLLFLPLLLSAQNAPELFDRHCAVCHGPQGRGGIGGSLIDGQWKHAPTDEARAGIIREGLPAFNKVGFAGILDDRQIRTLVIYLNELETQALASPPPRPLDGVVRTQHHAYRIETLTELPGNMWGLDFLPDGRMIVTEIDGAVRLLGADGTPEPPLRGTPAIVRHGQGGMLDVAVHPDYAENGWIYLAFAEGEGQDAMTTLVRGRIRGTDWVDQEVLFRARPEHRRNAGVHFGSRIVLKDGYVFFAIGDRGAQNQAQDLNRPNGKIFRLRDDGRIPEDNPFVAASAYPAIWSYGHRNPQALAFRPGTDELWSTEHGPRGGDELNHILPGRNYGWPTVTHGMNYNGTPITAETERPGMEPPFWHWTPSIAVCGMAFVRGDAFPNWSGDLLAGGLRSEVIERLRLGENGLLEREVVFQNHGRVRDVRTGPDGMVYVLVERGGGKLLRLRPPDR